MKLPPTKAQSEIRDGKGDMNKNIEAKQYLTVRLYFTLQFKDDFR